jgi:hypothetical protein
MSKIVKKGFAAKMAIMNGVNIAADAIKVTLGPTGKAVILDKGFGSPLISDDGVTVAKEIELEDKFENIGASLIQEVANKTNEEAGDGTTTATVLAQKMIEEEYPADEWNVYPFHFSDGDNWSAEDTRYCVELIKDKMLPRVNVFCYGQVESKYGSGQFIKDLEKDFAEDERVITSRIESREGIYGSIKTFLGKGK